MRARRVKGLDAAAPLADNAERIVRVRLDELTAFMPKAADEREVEALHDMRIAAKRLRYILEVTHPCFGPYAERAVELVKDVQDLLGELHDCDVQVPDVSASLQELVAEDANALVERARDGDLGPEALRDAPHAEEYAGLAALVVYLRARRAVLFQRFLELWRDYERKGFKARLEYAVAERPDKSERLAARHADDDDATDGVAPLEATTAQAGA